MADPLNILGYMLADQIRQRSNAERLDHLHNMALYNIAAPARTLQHGRDMNEYRGTTPFVVKNTVSGLRTAVAPGSRAGRRQCLRGSASRSRVPAPRPRAQ